MSTDMPSSIPHSRDYVIIACELWDVMRVIIVKYITWWLDIAETAAVDYYHALVTAIVFLPNENLAYTGKITVFEDVF
jgi:hypothetical protein